MVVDKIIAAARTGEIWRWQDFCLSRRSGYSYSYWRKESRSSLNLLLIINPQIQADRHSEIVCYRSV